MDQGLLIVERGLMITLRHTTIGRSPLDEWSARRRDLYLTIYNTHKRQTSMPLEGFDPTIPASERPQTHALDHAEWGELQSKKNSVSSLVCKGFSPMNSATRILRQPRSCIYRRNQTRFCGSNCRAVMGTIIIPRRYEFGFALTCYALYEFVVRYIRG
jgi:hypothetical protein